MKRVKIGVVKHLTNLKMDSSALLLCMVLLLLLGSFAGIDFGFVVL